MEKVRFQKKNLHNRLMRVSPRIKMCTAVEAGMIVLRYGIRQT